LARKDAAVKHTIQMLAGCIVPLLLLLILPLVGISGGAALLIAVVALFAGHLWMMPGRSGHGGGGGRYYGQHDGNEQAASGHDKEPPRPKGEVHECPQH